MCSAAQESVSKEAPGLGNWITRQYFYHSLNLPRPEYFFLLFWHQNRTKKRREFPEVTGQDLKEQRRRNPGFKKDVCKHEKETAWGGTDRRESQGTGREATMRQGTGRAGGQAPPTSMCRWVSQLTTPRLVDRASDVWVLASVPSSSKPRIIYSRLSHVECVPLTPTSQLSIFFLVCFPSSFSATVINSNTPSLKCQSKLHRDLRRTIVCLYA